MRRLNEKQWEDWVPVGYNEALHKGDTFHDCTQGRSACPKKLFPLFLRRPAVQPVTGALANTCLKWILCFLQNGSPFFIPFELRKDTAQTSVGLNICQDVQSVKECV